MSQLVAVPGDSVGSGVQLPCSMIQADIRTDVLQAEVMTVFAGPAVMIN